MLVFYNRITRYRIADFTCGHKLGLNSTAKSYLLAKLSFAQFLFHPHRGIKKTGHMGSGRNQGITEFEVIIVELDTHRR